MEINNVFKILGNADRLQIIEGLKSIGELNVQQIEAYTNIHQPTLSQQLTILRKAELVATRRDGKQIFYQINDGRVVDLIERATKLFNGAAA